MRILKLLGWYCAFSTMAALGLLVLAFPAHPKSPLEWLILFVIALPVTLVGEAIGTGLWQNRLAQNIEKQSAGQEFSWLRIMYGFIAMLIVFAAAWAGSVLFGVVSVR